MAWTEPKGQKFRGCYYDHSGRTRKTVVFPTERAARRAAQDEEAKLRAGNWIDPTLGKVTLADYVSDPLTGWLRMRRGEQTTRDTNSSLWNVIEPVLGHLELRQIRPSLVQAWVNDMEDAGVHPKTIHNRFTFLQSILAAKEGASAVRDGLIDKNPCHGVDLPHMPRRVVTIYQPEECDRLLLAMPEYWRSLVLFASETGLRWGELMGLTVGDFDLDYRSVMATRTIIRTKIENTGNGSPYMWKPWPKGRKPRRVALTPAARETLGELITSRGLSRDDRVFSMPTSNQSFPQGGSRATALEVHSASSFIAMNGRDYRHGTVNAYQTGRCRCGPCRRASADYRLRRLQTDVESRSLLPKRTESWPVGLPIDRGYFRRSVWLPANERAGLEPRRFHDLRASHVSWLLAMGVDLPSVMERVGHEDFNTTLRYAKALDDSEAKVLAALEGLRDRVPSIGGVGF